MNKIKKTSYYTREELESIGFNSLGENILLSRNTQIYSPENISLGNNVRIDDFCFISAGKEINIGSYIHISCFCALHGVEGIEMHDFSGLSSRVTIYTTSDDYSGCSLTNPTVPEEFKPGEIKGAVILKKHSIVGAGSTILPKVTLHEGVAVGAHSLVTKTCREWGIYFGSPVKYLKERKRDLLELEQQLIRKDEKK